MVVVIVVEDLQFYSHEVVQFLYKWHHNGWLVEEKIVKVVATFLTFWQTFIFFKKPLCQLKLNRTNIPEAVTAHHGICLIQVELLVTFLWSPFLLLIPACGHKDVDYHLDKRKDTNGCTNLPVFGHLQNSNRMLLFKSIRCRPCCGNVEHQQVSVLARPHHWPWNPCQQRHLDPHPDLCPSETL